jgi:hypothetical protein
MGDAEAREGGREGGRERERERECPCSKSRSLDEESK